ncbi:MAG: hypothetical protein FWG53_09125 [Clostridiales bacterium]|nr:hypothetical protein [Clostridiales bacterium]
MIFSKHKRNLCKALAILLLLALAIPFAAVAAAVAGGGAAKQEVVYINLNSDGSVEKIYVVNIFELTEDGQIVDFGDYAALRNMSSSDAIAYENQTVTIDSKSGKLYYEGELNSNIIPWSFKIRYFLDGAEYEAKDLAGQGGALKIAMSVRQNPYCNSAFFENYALQATFTFDTKNCSDIAFENATAANMGRNRLLTYTILPGKESDIAITANVSDFEMAAVTINGLPLSMSIDVDLDNNAGLQKEIGDLQDAARQFDDGAAELQDGITDLQSGANELGDGVADLLTGENDLADGASDLVSGSVDLVDNVLEMKDGAADLKDGADELYANIHGTLLDGAKELDKAVKKAVTGALEIYDSATDIQDGAIALTNGSSDLYSGLKELTLQSEALNAGAYSVFTQLATQAEVQLNQRLADIGMPRVVLTPENYSAVIMALLDALSGGVYSGALAAVEAEVRAEVEAIAMEQTLAAILSNDEAMAEISDRVEMLYGAALDAAAAAGAVREAIKAQYIDAIVASAVAMRMASAEVQEQIAWAVAAQLASDSVQSQIAGAIEAMLGSNESYQSILALKKSLEEYNTFYTGLREYTANVRDAASGASSVSSGMSSLSSGAYKLNDGAETLYDGLVVLKEGSTDLLDGIEELRDGSAELLDGMIKLHDGTIELYDGVLKLNDGTVALLEGAVELQDGTITLGDGVLELNDGISELLDGAASLHDGTLEFRSKTADMNTTLKDKIKAAIDDLLRGDFNPISFVSGKNTNIDFVQFVMKTTAIEKQAPPAPPAEQPEKLTFWQKFVRLFRSR